MTSSQLGQLNYFEQNPDLRFYSSHPPAERCSCCMIHIQAGKICHSPRARLAAPCARMVEPFGVEGNGEGICDDYESSSIQSGQERAGGRTSDRHMSRDLNLERSGMSARECSPSTVSGGAGGRDTGGRGELKRMSSILITEVDLEDSDDDAGGHELREAKFPRQQAHWLVMDPLYWWRLYWDGFMMVRRRCLEPGDEPPRWALPD